MKLPTITELKYLSERRLEASEVLANSGIHDIAFHDSGYIIELALKASICKNMDSNEYPTAKEYYTHHFDSLVTLSGLTEELANKRATDRQFMKNWSITTKWSVHMRYQPIGGNAKSKTETFINAVKSENGGVLPWIKTHW